jgi:hypothetical protein
LWLAVNVADGKVTNAQYRPGLKKFFDFKQLEDNTFEDYVPQQQEQTFDHFSGDTDQTQFSASLANEYLPFAWMLYKTYGAFEMRITSDLEQDLEEFGGFITSPYWADVVMRVDSNAQLTFKVEHRFEHRTTREDPRVQNEEIPRQDMSFDTQVYTLECDINTFNGTIAHEE